VEQPEPPPRFEPTKVARKLAALAHGAALTIMLLGGGPARAAGVVEPITTSGKALSYDLATATAADTAASKPSGAGAEWSPRVAYWSGHVGRSGLGRVLDRRTVRYRLNVGRHRVDVQLTKLF
jgi:hypothetical protein